MRGANLSRLEGNRYQEDHVGISPEDEVVRICQELIRIDTSNYGDNVGPGERKAAEYTAGLIEEVGLSTQLFESAPGRTSVVARMEGSDPSLPALVVHGHLDVVPAQKEDWTVDPFGGEEKDGLIWGRGAVDMKDMDAMILSVLRSMQRDGVKPRRDLIFGFFADEEAGGAYGASWLVDNKPEVFEGATEAISEVGEGSRRPSAGSGRTSCRPRRRASPGSVSWRTVVPATARRSTPTTR
ncbi:acetylornithine deacetylase/succinyl-diaminopimelate desuccinylase-like protein [Arthrobacter agilis]|nr:acetylornithine deacetylase/succinyl-diaminopimelate desuccinylase-like protein [Arthrobacter agilis]